MIETTVEFKDADSLFANPKLSQVDADRAALGWIGRYKQFSPMVENKEISSWILDRHREALTKYKDWSEARGVKPFAAKKEALAMVREEKLESNLPKFGELFSGDFEGGLSEFTSTDGYKRQIKLGADPEIVQDDYRRQLFLKKMTGRTDAVAQAFVAKNILGIDDPSDEAFVSAARGWVSGENKRREDSQSGFQSGMNAMIGGISGDELAAEWDKQKETSEAAGESFGKAVTQFKDEYGNMLPLVRRMVLSEKADGDRGLFQKSDGPEPVSEGIIALQYMKPGGREKFLTLLGQVMEREGGELDQNGFTKFIKSAGRGAESVSESLGRKFFRNNVDDNAEGRTDDEKKYWKAVQQVLTDTKDIKAAVSEVKGSNKVTQGIYDAGQSLPYMGMMASPLGVVTAALSIQEEHMEKIREIDPSVSEEDALWVATASAPIEVGIEKLQFMTLGGKVPGLKGALAKLTGGGLIRKIMATTALEYTQETVQEAVLPTVMDITSILKEDMPKGDWDDFGLMDSRRFFAVLPLSILGGGGQYARDKFTAKEVGDQLKDKNQIRMTGGTMEQADRIAEVAETNPDAALQIYRDEVLSKPAEERNKIADEAFTEIYEGQEEAAGALEGMPTIRPNAQGKITVDLQDGRVETVDTQQEAQVILDEWMREDFLNTGDAMKAFAEEIKEKSEGDNEVKIGKPLTLQQIAESGQQTAESLTKSIQVYYAQMGQEAPAKIDLANYTAEGSVRLRNKLGDYAVKLAKGANPLTVAEEFSEGFVRRAVQQGETTFDEVKILLDEFGTMSGLEMVQGFDVDAERAVIEGFSKFAKAYALQGDYASLPQETRAWFKKAWNVMENPASLPAPLRAMAELFAKMFKVVHDVAKAIEFHRADGNGLNADLEGLAKRALGLDEKAYAERMEEQYRKELMEDLYDPSEEISQQVKGKLPRPKDPAAKGYEGELSAIFDRFKKRSTGKNGKIKENAVAANQLFAKTGEGIPLDQLRADLNEQGFQFDTPADLLDAIEDSQRGNKQWPVTMGDDLQGQTFSISPTQDAAYLSAVESGDMEVAQEMVDEAIESSITNQLDDIGDYEFTEDDQDREVVDEIKESYGLDESEIDWMEQPAIIVTSEGFVIDGHHRMTAFRELGYQKARIITIPQEAYESMEDRSDMDPMINWASEVTDDPYTSSQPGIFTSKETPLSADPVTYDESGNVIPLSKRFDESRDEITFSITPTAQRENTLEAIDRLFTGPSGMVETGRKLREKLSKIQERFEANMFSKKFADEDTREFETVNALMQLNAIASVLPREVRHVVGSPVSLVTLKTLKAREGQVIKRLEKISLALDKHLQKELRESIRKELDKSGFKVSDSRRRKGKIGKIGHEVIEQVRRSMTMNLKKAEAEKASLQEEFDDIEAPQGEDFERWDSRTMATELFYDYENATTTRLEQALEFVTTNYKEGRAEWLTVLKARKVERDQFVAEAISFMGDEDRVWLEDLTKAENSAKGLKERFSEGFAEFIFSNHHTLARIVENAKDKDAAREWYNRLLDSRIQGDIKADREADDKQQAFFDQVANVIGATGPTKGHSVRKFLYEAKRTRKNQITTIEGENSEKVSIDKRLVESLLNGEVAGIDGEVYTAADLDALGRQWEKFEDLAEEDQNRVRKIKFDRVISEGERRPVGELSQAEALQWWLTMRQPDQREKLEAMGWDERTMGELRDFLSDDVKAVGLWMSKDLVADGKTLSDIHADEFGIGLNTGENYFPVRNRIVDQPVQMDMNDPGAGRNISPGSLKERVVNRARPAQANAFGTYFQHVTEMAYWKHNVGWVRQYGGAMKTKAFSEAMEAKVGKHAANSLQKYLAAVQNRGVNAGRQMLAFERLVKSMLSRVSLSVLGARVSTMWINATAFVNAFNSPDVSATAVMRNMFKMAFDSKGELKASWRNELAVMRRRMGASFEAQMAMKSGNAGHWLIQDAEKLAQKGLIPMNNIDVATNTLTMAAIYRTHYDAAIKRGESEQEAREFADAGLTRAHATLAQPTLSISRSQAEMATSQNPFMGIFTMFMSEVRKNGANNYVAWRTLMTGKGIVDRPTAARQAAVYTLVYTGVVQAFRGIYDVLTGDDEDDEEVEKQLQDPKFWAYAIASDNLRPVPLLGDATLSMMAGPLDQKYWDQKTPITRIVGQWKQMDRIFDEDATDSEKIDEVIDQMQSWGSVLPGGPIFAEAGNLGDFAKDVYENGMGHTFSESDQIKKDVKGILENKEAIYERTEDKEERVELLADVIGQYRKENPKRWETLEKALRQKKEGKDVKGADGKPLYKVPRDVMERLVD